jgi:hypothetical protein
MAKPSTGNGTIGGNNERRDGKKDGVTGCCWESKSGMMN